MAVDDRLRRDSFRLEQRPYWDVAVPLDERRYGPAPADHDIEQFPDRICDRAVVAVDAQKVALVVGLFGMAGEMDFSDVLERKIREIVKRGKAMVGSRNEHVVDVQQ